MSRTRAIVLGLTLTCLTTLFVGLLVPNRDPVTIGFMWWHLLELPLWGSLVICVLGGALLGSAGMAWLWVSERRRRQHSGARTRELEAEVGELRRLMAREATGGER